MATAWCNRPKRVFWVVFFLESCWTKLSCRSWELECRDIFTAVPGRSTRRQMKRWPTIWTDNFVCFFKRVMEKSLWGYKWTMLLCFGGRRRNRHHQVQWSEKDCLLDDEPQIITNPCFLNTGKAQRKLMLYSWASLSKHMDILLVKIQYSLHQDFPDCTVRAEK